MTAPAGAPFNADRVQLAVVSFLNAIVSAAASFTPALSLPARQIAGAGTIPHDCEEIYASWQTITTGTPEALGMPGSSTWPATASGANQTLYQASVILAIVRKTNDTPTGLNGQFPPTPAAYLANLAQSSDDIAILFAAVSQIASAQMSATPRTGAAGAPQGGLVATTCRVNVLI